MARTYPHSTETWSKSRYGNHFLTEHFQVKEFACKDGADEVVICPELLLNCLEPLFTRMGAKAINITSGYRTASHSLKVGGKGEKDNHHMGMAADIKVKKPDGTYFSSKDITLALEDMGWNGGVGLINKQNAVHVDAGSKLYFDETNNSKTVQSWYTYWGVSKSKTVSSTASAHRGTAYTMTCNSLAVRKKPSLTSKRVGQFSKGETFYVVARQGDWCQLESGNWMCAGKYLKRV